MSEEPIYYGHFEHRRGYPLADWLFGHRLHEGQHWMEYLLEFLNVLIGFDYRLGQGDDNRSAQKTYKRYARYGLRRFVFYDDREKTKDPRDDLALRKIEQLLRERTSNETGGGGRESTLDRAHELLRSYSAIEEARSWYAKSLFPAHEELLFWEARRNKRSPRRPLNVSENTSSVDLDEEMELSARNFFARGGEIYYLSLSAGTESQPGLRDLIEHRLRTLLVEHNQSIGRLARVIDLTWRELRQDSGEALPSEIGTLGWLPDPECQLHREIAQDIAMLLQAKLDPLESLDLLAHLICFHLLIYIYHRAHPDHTSAVCMHGDCLHRCRPLIPIDCMEGQSAHIRSVSAALYKEWEQRQLQKARAYVQSQVMKWAAEVGNVPDFAERLSEQAKTHFNVDSFDSSTLNPYREPRARLQHALTHDKLLPPEYTEYTQAYAEELTQLLLKNFHKQFLGVHRKLARSIGFIVPYRGPSQRYVLSDALLKALVLANVPPGKQLIYDDFLARLYTRYGLVIGQHEARVSGLYDRKPINAEYYDDNRVALLKKLKNTGLLREYSDATALVVNESVA